jgi:enoyl-[acyl-carrier protein] reductase II
MVAALALGAQGVVVGTRFIASREATAASSYQNAIVSAVDDSTTRTRCYTGKPARTIRNPYVAEWEREPARIQPFPQQIMVSMERNVMDYMGIQGDCDPETSFMPAGQGSGLVHDVRPAGDILRSILREAEEIVRTRLAPLAADGAGPRS